MHGAQRESINRKLDVARAVVLMLQDPLERWFTHGVVLYYRWLMLKYCFFSPVMYAHFCCFLAVHGDTVTVTVSEAEVSHLTGKFFQDHHLLMSSFNFQVWELGISPLLLRN